MFNSVNILLGVGLLSVPYALAEGGWSALGVLGLLGATTNYTGKAIVRCMNAPLGPLPPEGTAERREALLAGRPLTSYEAIGERAFGEYGRGFITAVLYTELVGTCGLFFILAGDHLAELSGHAHSSQWFMLASAALMVPTTWLADLSSLSYIGLLGTAATALLAGVIGWEFAHAAPGSLPELAAHTEALHGQTFPLTFGLLAFVFAGHAVFPNIYLSMEEPDRYPELLDRTYAVVGAACLAVGAMGYLLYGPNVSEEVTLNLPSGTLSTVALAAIVINPFAKFALTLDPVARGVERWAGLDAAGEGKGAARASRTALSLGALGLATSVPYFGVVMSLIGSFMTLTVSVVFPSLCLLRICGDDLGDGEKALNWGVVVLGGACAASGTVAALQSLQP